MGSVHDDGIRSGIKSLGGGAHGGRKKFVFLDSVQTCRGFHPEPHGNRFAISFVGRTLARKARQIAASGLVTFSCDHPALTLTKRPGHTGSRLLDAVRPVEDVAVRHDDAGGLP